MRDEIRISSQPFYSVTNIRRRFTSKLVFRKLAKNMVRAIWLANGKDDSDIRLNAMLLDVWEANANRDIYILIRLELSMLGHLAFALSLCVVINFNMDHIFWAFHYTDTSHLVWILCQFNPFDWHLGHLKCDHGPNFYTMKSVFQTLFRGA